MINRLENSIQYIKGVGPRRTELLKKLGVEKVWDMLWHAPRHYFDRTAVESINQLVPGQEATVRACIRRVTTERTYRGFKVVKAWLEDDTGSVEAIWFNQEYLGQVLRPGTNIFATGKVIGNRGVLEIRVSEFEMVEKGEALGAARIVPVYRSTMGLGQKTLRSIACQVLQYGIDGYPELLPLEIRRRYGLPEIQAAFRCLHFPESFVDLARARQRLALEELLLWQWAVHQKRNASRSELPPGRAHRGGEELVQMVTRRLPYRLTAAQERVVAEIALDLAADKPMKRLLQGDVGSGKTVVAALAAAKMAGDGYQTAFMAPTEILAIQHYRALCQMMEPVPVRVMLLTGSTPLREKREILAMVAGHEADILVGTHALIQEQVQFACLGLAIIDEQQRFGVRQRGTLMDKGDWCPDMLVMSATPIPRTLALAFYGDLDISTIEELPPGRKTVKTIFIKPSMEERLYRFIRGQVKAGRQVYIVCPLVEESEKQDLQAATTLQETLQKEAFIDLRVGLLHGRMKTDEKEAAITAFRQGIIDILVTTTVLEVGIDVANASVMVIQHAERFGLSQLHQLRGRVGRGNFQSYCVLVGEPHTRESWHRLKTMEKTNDGFEIARQDLLLRGPGDFWGVRQHGLPLLRVADLAKDGRWLDSANQLTKTLGLDEELLATMTRLHLGPENHLHSN